MQTVEKEIRRIRLGQEEETVTYSLFWENKESEDSKETKIYGILLENEKKAAALPSLTESLENARSLFRFLIKEGIDPFHLPYILEDPTVLRQFSL